MLTIKVMTIIDRQELAGFTGINDKDILKLTRLTDLSRIKLIGVTFARMLYDFEIEY